MCKLGVLIYLSSITNFHIQLAYRKLSKSVIKEPQIDTIPSVTIIQDDPKCLEDNLMVRYFISECK
jgi:hypothetical protein